MPHLVDSLCTGDLSLDKVRAVADVATPETDQEYGIRPRSAPCASWPTSPAEAPPAKAPPGRSEHERRFLRFNEQYRTMTVQLPPESFAETRACLEARARQVPSDGETPWDQRLCDAFMELIRSAHPGGRASTTSPYFVVVHVLWPPWSTTPASHRPGRGPRARRPDQHRGRASDRL